MVGSTSLAVGRTGKCGTSIPCYGSMATSRSTVPSCRREPPPALHPRRQGRHRAAAARKASPPRAFAPYSQPVRRSTNIVIRDGRAAPSSVPPCVKKEPHVKDEPRMKDVQMKETAPEKDERPWWVNERELKKAAHHSKDPVDTPGLHLLQARSYSRPSRWPGPGPPRGRSRTTTTSSTSPRTTTR
jgi:hypothetical protein